MAQYKIVHNSVGPWTKDQVITDADLKDNPQFGGVERLRDQLGAIADHYDAPPANPAPAVTETTTAEGAVPNAAKAGHQRSGKS